MVNVGRPSFGCQNCKQAHRSCDQASPACGLCVRQKRKCEYPDVLNITFRDETRAIQTKSDHRRRQARNSALQETLALRPNSESIVISIVSPFTCVGVAREEFAVAVLFSRRVGGNNDKDNPHGFMQFLPRLFASASPNTPLERATYALAMFACQHIFGAKGATRSCAHLGGELLGQALRLINHAIRDPKACRRDETLMAVMVLNIIDKLLCMVDRRPSSDAHLLGASQLIRLRGRKNFSNEASQRILAGVHAETVGKALGQCVPMNEIPGGFCSKDWVGGLTQYPDFAAGLLNHLAESVANIQALVRAFLNSPSCLNDARASTLVATVLKIDRKLMDWESAMPDAWRPRLAGDLSLANLATFQAYGMTMETYKSVWIANTYNSFRMLRILLQVLAHDIVSSHPRVRATAFPCGPLAYSCTAQRLIDEVGASVPFFMGTRGPGVHHAAVQFPAAEGCRPSLADRQNTLQVGAWLLLAPLKTCATYELIYTSQRIWIESQIERINSFHNLQGSYEGSFPNWQINLGGKGISRMTAKASGGV